MIKIKDLDPNKKENRIIYVTKWFMMNLYFFILMDELYTGLKADFSLNCECRS